MARVIRLKNNDDIMVMKEARVAIRQSLCCSLFVRPCMRIIYEGKAAMLLATANKPRR
jgi:hypothetical protein